MPQLSSSSSSGLVTHADVCVCLRVSETAPGTVLLLAAVPRWLMGG